MVDHLYSYYKLSNILVNIINDVYIVDNIINLLNLSIQHFFFVYFVSTELDI